MGKMTRAERAKQFMPFSPLRGFGELLKEQEALKEERRELSEEEREELSRRFARVKRGDEIAVSYYTGKGYAVQKGALQETDFLRRTMRVGEKTISFDDVEQIFTGEE